MPARTLPYRCGSGRAVTVASWFSSAISTPARICTSFQGNEPRAGLALESVFFQQYFSVLAGKSRGRGQHAGQRCWSFPSFSGAAHPSGRRLRSDVLHQCHKHGGGHPFQLLPPLSISSSRFFSALSRACFSLIAGLFGVTPSNLQLQLFKSSSGPARCPGAYRR